MATITQHVPPCLKGAIASVSTFSTQEELFNVSFVRMFSVTNSGKPDKLFHRFSLNGNKLMVESFGGRFSNIVGVIDDTRNLHLPDWIPKNEEDP